MPLADSDKTPVDVQLCPLGCGETSMYVAGPLPWHPPPFCRTGDGWYYCSVWREGQQRVVYADDLYDV